MKIKLNQPLTLGPDKDGFKKEHKRGDIIEMPDTKARWLTEQLYDDVKADGTKAKVPFAEVVKEQTTTK